MPKKVADFRHAYGLECRRLLEAAEKTVSRSFLRLEFVVSQSVMPVELFVYLAEQNALL